MGSVVLLFLKHFKSLTVMDEERLYHMLCMLLFHRTDRACWDELSFQNNFITELPCERNALYHSHPLCSSWVMKGLKVQSLLQIVHTN